MNTLHPDTIDAFHALLQEHPAVLVDFYKDQCPGCKMLDASLAKVAASPALAGVVLVKAKMEVLGEAFFRDLGLRQTPTLAAYAQGKEVARRPGYATPAQIEALAQGAWPAA